MMGGINAEMPCQMLSASTHSPTLLIVFRSGGMALHQYPQSEMNGRHGTTTNLVRGMARIILMLKHERFVDGSSLYLEPLRAKLRSVLSPKRGIPCPGCSWKMARMRLACQ